MLKLVRLFALATLCITLTGCGAVEWKHRHPDVTRDDPSALLIEDELREGNIACKVNGFVQNRSDSTDHARAPIPFDYTTSESIAKGFYTITPYGLFTLPFAELQARKIVVPPGEIGIVIQYTYYKRISKEEEIDLAKELHFTIQAESYEKLNKYTPGEGNKIYKVVQESLEWNEIIWASLSRDQEYTLKMLSKKLVDSNDKIIAGADMDRVAIPDELTPVREQLFVTFPSPNDQRIVGHSYRILSDGHIVFMDKEGKDLFTLIKSVPSK